MPGRTVSKPWGHELIWAQTASYVGKILVVRAGEALSLQFHERKDETVMLLSGEMDFTSHTETSAPITQRMQPREPIHIPPGLRHRMVAITDCEIVEVSTPELDDVVRLEDRYGRTP